MEEQEQQGQQEDKKQGPLDIRTWLKKELHFSQEESDQLGKLLEKQKYFLVDHLLEVDITDEMLDRYGISAGRDRARILKGIKGLSSNQGSNISKLDSFIKSLKWEHRSDIYGVLRQVFNLPQDWPNGLSFLPELRLALKKTTAAFQSYDFPPTMLTGVRRSGKTTLMKLFCWDNADTISKNKFFIFHFDFSLFVSGTYELLRTVWFFAIQKALQDQINFTPHDPKLYQHLLKVVSSDPVTDTSLPGCYLRFFVDIVDIAVQFQYHQVLFVLDEFEKTFPIITEGNNPAFTSSFNETLKKIIDSTKLPIKIVLAGTDAIQMAFAGCNGGEEISVLSRGIPDENIITTSGLVNYSCFLAEYKKKKVDREKEKEEKKEKEKEKEKEEEEQEEEGQEEEEEEDVINWPLLDEEQTCFDDFGGVAAYLFLFVEKPDPVEALKHLRNMIVGEIGEDLKNLINIKHFKKNLPDNIVDAVKIDLLALLNGLEPIHLDMTQLGIHTFIQTVKMKIRAYAIIWRNYILQSGSKMTTAVAMALETHPSVLGWKLQNAVCEHFEDMVTKGRYSLEIPYLGEQFAISQIESVSFMKTASLDLASLSSVTGLDASTFYYDPGEINELRTKQWHLPGIDAICGGNFHQNKVYVDSYQIKSTIKMLEPSIVRTIVKFVVIRHALNMESVLTCFVKKCYHFQSVEVYLNLDGVKTGIEEENTLTHKIHHTATKFNGITFSGTTQDGNVINGEVNLYLLAFGAINLDLVRKYSGVRFVWGPSSLEKFIGYKMMNQLKKNERFQRICLFADKNFPSLPTLDKEYELVEWKVDGEIQKYWCLRGTSKLQIQQYIATFCSLGSVTDLEVEAWGNSYSVKTPKKVKKRQHSGSLCQQQKRSCVRISPDERWEGISLRQYQMAVQNSLLKQ